MFNRISRSWQLIKASWAVLQQDRQLLVFPLVSAIAAILVIASFALPVFGIGTLGGLPDTKPSTISTLTYATGFLFYVCLYFVVFYFNAALVGAAMMRFDGAQPTVGDGLRLAGSRAGSILGYAVLAATVGVVLRFIQERVGFVGKIIAGFLGAGWTVATYLVVPVLVVRDTGPLEAVKESATILKKTWGENIIGQAGIGTAFWLIHFLILMTGLLLTLVAVKVGSGALVLFMVFTTMVAVIFAALVQIALGGIYAAALYRFATGLPMSNGFNSASLQGAFAQK